MEDTKSKERFIRVTQDGYAKLRLDDEVYDGLCTDGLETCIGLFIYGENGMVLFHDKGKISTETIKKEAEWSKILYWRVVVNRAFYNEEHKEHVGRYVLKLDPILGKDKVRSILVYRFVSFNKQGDFDDEPNSGIEEIPPINENERETINWLNFSFYGHEELAGDLQYDSERLTINSELYKPLKNKQDLNDLFDDLYQFMKNENNPETSRILMLVFLSPTIWISLLAQENAQVKDMLFFAVSHGSKRGVPPFFVKHKMKTLEKAKYCLENNPITLKIQESRATSIIEKDHLAYNLEHLCKTVYKLQDSGKSSIERAFRNAAVNNMLEDVKILGSVIQDINAENKDKKTALIYAQERGHKKVSEYLQELLKQKS